MNKFWKCFFYLLIPPSMALTGWGAYQISTHGHLLLGILCGGGGLFFAYLMSTVGNSRVEINAAEIRYTEMFKTKALPLDAIAGFRILPTGQVKTLALEPKEPGLKKVKIALTLERQNELLAWLNQNLTNLDQVEYQQGLVEIYQNESLGGSPEEKAAALQKARKWCRALHAVSVGSCFWAILFPRPYAAALWTLICLPFVGLLFLRRFEGLAKFNAKRNSPYPNVSTALFMPAMGLILRASVDWHVLEWPAFWAPFATISAGLVVFSLLFVREIREKAVNVLLMGFFAALYAAGATLDLNGLLAEGKITTYHAKVLGKHFTSSKTTTYYLTLTPWQDRTEKKDATVSRAVYTHHTPGDTAEILVRTGRFGIPFYWVR